MMSAGPQMSTTLEEVARSVDVNGIATNYQDEGEGPVILLLHGSGPGVTAYANWRFLIPRLSQAFRVIAPDLLGFGYTESAPGQVYDVDTWVQHISGFLDTVGVERCSIVGNSFGGAMALHLAARYPERCESLVLMGSAGGPFELTPGLDLAWGYRPSLETMRELLERFSVNKKELVSDDLVRSRYLVSLRPETCEAYESMFPAPRQRWIDALALSETQLGQITCETLLIHGSEDQIIPLEASERLRDLLPHAELHILPESGHWVQADRPDDFFDLVFDFLSRRTGPRQGRRKGL